MRFSIFLSFFIVFQTANLALAFSSQKAQYYGADFVNQVQAGKLKNEALLIELHKVVANAHVQTPGAFDKIIPDCAQNTSESVVGQSCAKHTALGYDKARKYMFGSIHLEKTSDGKFTVKDVYCEKYFTDADFDGKPNIGPGLIPSSGSILNTEHTWPQSRFTSRFNKEMQKSDLHHLYPTDSQMNSHRSSLRFGNVYEDMDDLKCSQSRLGRSHENPNQAVFEPPVSHRGNVARALFYFAVRYQMKISPGEEAALRRWHKEDPVDSEEVKRNNLVQDYQGNRNPFIDYPDFVDEVTSFQFVTTSQD